MLLLDNKNLCHVYVLLRNWNYVHTKLFFFAKLCFLCCVYICKYSYDWCRKKYHSDLECLGTFGNWFWDRIVGNRSIVLNFLQQSPVFVLKNYPRPQRPKRPVKAKKGHQRPKLPKIIDFINNQCKIINKWECDTKKKLFFKNW